MSNRRNRAISNRKAPLLIVITIAAVFFLGGGQKAFGSLSWAARVTDAGQKGQGIPDLRLDRADIPVMRQKTGASGEYRLIVDLRGTWNASDESVLLYQNKQVPISKGKKDEKGAGNSRRFVVRIPVRGETTPVELTAIDPYGNITQTKWIIIFPGWTGWQASLQNANAKKMAKNDENKIATKRSPHSFSTSLGISIVSYKEKYIPDFTQTGLTAKFAYSYQLSDFKPVLRNWDLGANAYFTAMALSTNQPETSARFIGMNGRVGYLLPFIPSPWQMKLMAGAYFATMMVTDAVFGFQNMMGPQVFPTISRPIGANDSIGGYFKFSPIGASLSLLDLSNREIAFGGSWRHGLQNGKSLLFSVDWAQFNLEIGVVKIESQSLSFSIGYLF